MSFICFKKHGNPGILESDQVVVCTQPRRVAAITLAEYVAKDRGQEIGLANDLDKMCLLAHEK